MTKPLPSRLVRGRKLAEILGVSPRTVQGWVQQGLIPYVAPSSRINLFDPEQVLHLLTTRFGFAPGAGQPRPHTKGKPAASGETTGSQHEHTSRATLHPEGCE